MQNSWLVYRRIAEERDLDKLDFLTFTRRITLYYSARRKQEYRGRPSKRPSRSGVAVLPEIRFDRLNHLVVFYPQPNKMCTMSQKGATNMPEM